MESGHRTFIAGTILGITLGLLLGHFALWRHDDPPRTSPIHVAVAQHAELADEPLTTASQSETDLTTAFAVAPNQPAELMSEIPLSGQIGSVPQLLPLTDAESSGNKSGSGKELAEPAPLRIPEASPLPSADTVPNSHDAIRELIAQEMANSTPQEREVWFDSLKELSLPHAVGVLEMWKLSGRGAPPASPGPLWSSPTLPQEVPSPFFQEMNLSAAPSQIELRARDNLQFAVTPGYKRRRAVAHQTVDGRLVWSTEIDFSPGQHAFTFMPLDWAIEGSEFFVVSHENATYFTRCGHFTLDADHYLALQLGDDYYRLQPEICLPENAQQILIDEKCAVLVKTENNEETIPLTLASFINPAGLEPAGSTLFKATAASGSPLIANASEGTVVQFALEQSNVIPNEEWERIKAHQRLSGLTP